MATQGYHGAHAGTRLGGRPFNHGPSSSSEQEYDRLRDAARSEHGKMSSCFDRAHQAYSRGDGGEAHQLSEEGNRHKAQAAEYNRQASEYIFRENNATDRVPGDTIDLHGQFVEEAEDILEARIKQAQSQGQDHLHVIVGKGNHSPGHIQKIKPRVEQVCQELGLQYATEENAGRIYVNLTGGHAQMPPQHQWAPGYSHGGYGDGGYPGQAQPQYQSQHGKPQQQFQQDDFQKQEEALLKMCINKCCTIM